MPTTGTVDDQTVIFQAHQVRELGFPGSPVPDGFWNPTPLQVEAFDMGLRQALERARIEPGAYDPWAAKSNGRANFIREETGKILERLPEYRRQVFGIVVDGEQRLYVSFLPGADWDSFGDGFEDWRERTLAVSDGGFWFWNIQYVPSTGQYLLLESHGYA